MGSWNGTCGVSQLPIMYGDDVAIFLMKKNKYNREDYMGCVHSDNFYEPVSPAIFGRYDDYGRVTDVIADKRVISGLYGEQDDYSDIGNIIDEQSEKKGLYIMLVHLEVYKEIVVKFGVRNKFFTKKLSFNEFMRNQMLAYLTTVREDPEGFHIELDHNHFKMSTGFALRFYQNPEIYEDNMDNDSLVDSVVDYLVFKDAMQDSRKLWIPQAGNGSQDQDYDMVKIVGEFAVKKENEDDEW